MSSQKFIVYTRPNGGVDVCAPSLNAMRYMTNGGGRWDGVIPVEPLGFLDRQIAEQAKYGVGDRAARRFVMAMHKGGCTDAEAYEIMIERFCAPHGTAFELTDALPFDRWFRDAWQRSHNGGPIGISMPAARRIQIKRIKAHAKKKQLTLRLPLWRERIRSAASPEQLKSIWPTLR